MEEEEGGGGGGGGGVKTATKPALSLVNFLTDMKEEEREGGGLRWKKKERKR